MTYQTPEGWKSIHKSPVMSGASGAENSTPVNSIGQPQLAEGEMVIDDGEVNNRQYFLVQCPDSKIKVIIPGLKDNQDYVGAPKRTKQDALQDAFSMLNATLPTDYLGLASKRTSNKVY